MEVTTPGAQRPELEELGVRVVAGYVERHALLPDTVEVHFSHEHAVLIVDGRFDIVPVIPLRKPERQVMKQAA